MRTLRQEEEEEELRSKSTVKRSVKLTTNHSIKVVEAWMRSRKLELAHHKTEVTVVSNMQSAQQTEISVGECTILSKRSVKHLGVMIDDKLTFGSPSIMPVKEPPQLLRHCPG